MMILVSTVSARPQNAATDDVTTSKLADGIDATLVSLKPALLKNVPDQFQPIARIVSFRINRKDFGISVYATKDQTGGREVVFSLGAVQALDAINRSYAEVLTRRPLTTRARISARATLFSVEMGRLSRRAEDIISAGGAGRLGQSISRIPSFCEHIRAPSASDSEFCETLHENSEYQQLYLHATAAAYTLIMGHELSHHFLLHTVGDTNFQKQGNETVADEWGMRFISATGQDLASSLNGLILLKLAEPWRGPSDPFYPKATCRIRAALNGSISELFSEPNFSGAPPSPADVAPAQAWEIRQHLLREFADEC
jgi:hypothetical protein